LLLGIVCLPEDAEDPYGIVASLGAAAPRGSYLVVTHPGSDIHAADAARGAREYQRLTGRAQTNRSREGVTRFFCGLDVLPPGVVPCNQWRPAPGEPTGQLSNWAAIGRKP
jgi:hypothetical protein